MNQRFTQQPRQRVHGAAPLKGGGNLYSSEDAETDNDGLGVVAFMVFFQMRKSVFCGIAAT